MSWAGSFGLLLLLGSLAFIPGPSDLLVAASAVRRGYSSAVRITLGILFADLIFILAVVYGASVLLEWLNAYEHWLRWMEDQPIIRRGMNRIVIFGNSGSGKSSLLGRRIPALENI